MRTTRPRGRSRSPSVNFSTRAGRTVSCSTSSREMMSPRRSCRRTRYCLSAERWPTRQPIERRPAPTATLPRTCLRPGRMIRSIFGGQSQQRSMPSARDHGVPGGARCDGRESRRSLDSVGRPAERRPYSRFQGVPGAQAEERRCTLPGPDLHRESGSELDRRSAPRSVPLRRPVAARRPGERGARGAG